MVKKICVAGAGTMGSGIALAASQFLFDVILFDTNKSVLLKARDVILKNLKILVDKKKIDKASLDEIYNRILFTELISDCTADLVIEAIIEVPEAKVALFNQLAEYNTYNTIFASNTSSLSISSLQQQILNPNRFAGMHFFNPAQVMKLVEVVKGQKTEDSVISQIVKVCVKMNKTPVICKDAPGFIVNRVARHYYLEAMHLVENGLATFENVDKIMETTGFKMGPFKLMDLIGMDINLATSRSLYDALNVKRLEPSQLQIEKVEQGFLGKKTGQGFYSYPVNK